MYVLFKIFIFQNNEEMKVKEREIQDTLTDLRSRVAITTSDKERLYQEKLDLNAKVENTTLHNKQLEEVCLLDSKVFKFRLLTDFGNSAQMCGIHVFFIKIC